MMATLLSRIVIPLCLLGLAATDARACSGRLHLEVRDAGVYALDQAAIVAAQPSLADCASAELVLTQQGREVPMRIVGDSAGRFAAGSRIEWLGQALHGPQSWYDPYSLVNVYQLGAAPGAHLRVHAAAAVTDAAAPVALLRSLHLEQENLLLRLNNNEMHPGDEPDVWQWAKMTPVDPHPFTLAFDLPDAELRASTAQDSVAFTLDLRGVSNVVAPAKQAKPIDHRVEIALNGKPLPVFEWDGRDELRRTFQVPRAWLKEQGNSIVLHVPKRPLPWDAANFIVDAVMVNWLEASYPARGDLSASSLGLRAAADGSAPLSGGASLDLYGSDGSFQHLEGASRAALLHNVDYYAATVTRVPQLRAPHAADLRDAGAGYDYLIVAHARLLDAIAPLAQFHRAQGLRVAVYDVDDVYEQFNGGIAHPRAIRDLVAWGTQHWTRKPRYLLLVGDASTDIHHDPKNGQLSGSSYLLTAQPPGEQVLQDNGFAGMTSYPYPQASQLPTRNLIPTWQFPSAEGQSASDNDFVTMQPGDFHPTLAVGRFPVTEPAEVKAIVDKTIAYMSKPAPGDWRREVTFISTTELASFKQSSDLFAAELAHRGFATRSVYTNAEDRDPGHYQQARSTLRDNLDGGDLLVHFMGHGGSYIWRVGAMGDLFSLDDVSALKNAGRYPMVLAMTCFSAPFDNPTDDSIGERFLREADKGAVAVFAASWKNWPNPSYSRSLIDELLKPGNRIGDAIVAAKAKIPVRDFVEMYNLLGDPAVVLAQPPGRLEFMLAAGRWDARVVVRVPAADFGGDIDVEWTDAQGAVSGATRYQLRDTLFSLPVPEDAVEVRMYATDARTGFAAFGAASVLPPPEPQRAAVAGAAHGVVHDQVARRDFEKPAKRGAGTAAGTDSR